MYYLSRGIVALTQFTPNSSTPPSPITITITTKRAARNGKLGNRLGGHDGADAPVHRPSAGARRKFGGRQFRLQINDPSLKSLVIGPTLPHSLSYVLQNRPAPERHLPESEEEWCRVGEQIGAHSHIEELEFYQLEYTPRSNLEALLSGLADNRSVRRLQFTDSDIGRWAFETIAPFLARNPNLRKLEVNSCYLNAPFLALAPVLEGSTLEKFQLMGNRNPRSFTRDRLDEMEQCLCNTTSIDATYLSNHQLSSVAVYNESSDGMSERLVEFPTKLKESLKLNKNSNKAGVAREKILRSHFLGEYSLKPFNEEIMDLGVLPFLLSWLGRPDRLGPVPDDRAVSLMRGRTTITRGRENECSHSAMFELLRRIPKRVFGGDHPYKSVGTDSMGKGGKVVGGRKRDRDAQH